MKPLCPGLIGLLFGLLATAVPADVYRWVDEDGVVHFSDEPRTGAERIDVGEPATVQLPQGSPVAAEQAPKNESGDARAASYERFAISSPRPGKTIQSAPGRVPIALALHPGLRDGHVMTLLLDGEPVPESPLNSLELTLEAVDRGTHTVQARVIDSDGTIVASTESVTFYLHRPSVNLPPR